MTAKLNQTKFILASGSPRRKELLGLIGLEFDVKPADVDESLSGEESPSDYVSRVSKSKALATKPFVNQDCVVISADTCVVHKGDILGKPKSTVEAVDVLQSMRSISHTVISGLSLYIGSGEQVFEDLATTEVEMRNYSDDEIQKYVRSGNPMDKAGSYAIQHEEFHPVENVTGCMANVIGLPLCHLTRTMLKADIDVSNSFGEDVAQNCQAYFNYDCLVFEQVLQGEL